MSFSNLSLRFVLLVAAVMCIHSQALAQPSMRVGKNDAYAIVREQTGYINWYTTVGDTRLSFDSKSFVSFKIKNKIFTNNDALPPGTTSLPYGTLSRKGPQPGVNDTITLTWKNVDGIDIMQDVWAIGVSEEIGPARAQLGVRFRFKNNTGGAVDIATQYLLDVQIGAKDGAKTLTRHGYERRWVQYGRGAENNLPPFFINFQNDLPNAPSYDPGLSGQGFFINDPWGLRSPFRVTIGHWPTLERIAWGPPTDLPTEDILDNAILMEWDPVTVLPGDSTRGPSFTYGTGDYMICIGKLMAIIFHPKKLALDPVTTNYLPNPFNVDVFLLNPEINQVAQNVRMKLEVGPNLTLVGVPPPSKVEEVSPSPDFINADKVTFHSWSVLAEKHKNCTEPLTTWVKLEAVSSLGVPHLGQGENTCLPQIILPCTEQDLEAPRTSNHIGTDNDSVQSFDVDDNRTKDSGLDKVTYVASSGDINNFTVTIGQFTACSKQVVPITIKQKDSTKAGCISFTFTDCVGNTSSKEVCFKAHSVPEAIDSLAPVFTLVERLGSTNGTDCNSMIDSIMVTETRDGDKGLATLTVTPGYPVDNMQLVSGPITNSASHRFSLQVIDRFRDGKISVTATDVTGNKDSTEYTYCTIKDTLAPEVKTSLLIRNKWTVSVEEIRLWDRLIDEIRITNLNNVTVTPMPTIGTTRGKDIFTFEVEIIDTAKIAGWCVQAFDLAGNKTIQYCYDSKPPQDLWNPNITVSPALTSNPWKVTVNINDIHYRPNDTASGPIPYDSGIQEVWFTANNGMTVGMPQRTYSPTVMQVPFFEIFATDTNNPLVPKPCVTIHARDSVGNLSSLTYCHDLNPDDLPPIITGVAAFNDALDLHVRDDQTLDRGLRRVELLNFDNFVAMDPILVAGDKTLDVRIDLDNPAKSAFGRLQALDMWGSNSESPQVRDLHTAWVDVAIWVQPFQMKKSYLIEKTGEFVVPIKTIENDTFSLYRKGIRSMRFSFDITGDPQVTFVRAETDETMTAGWTINPMVQNNGRTVMIEAIAPAGSVLDGPSTMDVLRLVFVGAESDLTKSAEVSITPINGRFVEINRGAQDTVLGQYSNAILPAPQSEVNGFSVVVAGRCAPLVQAGDAKTSSIALHPIAPNPVSGSGRVRFEVGKDGPVSLRLYNSIGETVLSMVDGQITSGLYEQQFDVNGLASGSYYLRLESQGKVLTKVLKIAR